MATVSFCCTVPPDNTSSNRVVLYKNSAITVNPYSNVDNNKLGRVLALCIEVCIGFAG
jgi:hypothetical protein